jgi:FlaA1/EpsC-like NDP-sugar epimerase
MQQRLYEIAKSLPRRWKRRILLGVDIGLVLVALSVARIWHMNSNWSVVGFVDVWPIYALLVVIAGVVSMALGIPRIKLKAYETRAIIRTGILSAVLAVSGIAMNVLGQTGLATAVFFNFGFLFFGLSVASRLVGLRILQWIYFGAGDRTRVLIYGAGATGVQLVAALNQSEVIEPIGFVDDNQTLQSIKVAGLPVFASARIPDLVRKMEIDRIVLAMPSLSLPRQAQIARKLEKLGCDVHRLPSFSELVGNRDLENTLEPVRPADFLGRVQHDTNVEGVAGSYGSKTVLVSGAGGSIGSELCRQLLACKPKKIVLFEQSEPALYAIDQEMRALAEDIQAEIAPVLGSVCDKALDLQVLADHKVDIILHAAAHKHVPLVEMNEVEGLRNNILGTRILAEAAQMQNVAHFVLVSSDKAARPTNVMGASKRLAELVIQDFASRSKFTRFSMVRFGNVLGSSGSVVPLFQEQIARGGPVTLTDRQVTRYFMTLIEAAQLVLLAGSFARGGDVFVLDMGKPVVIRDLARQMIQRAGYTVRDAKHPDGDIEIAITGLRPGEKLFEELLIGADMQTTPHPKILRAQEEKLSEIEVATMLKDLRIIVKNVDAKAARALVKKWVKGYQSAGNRDVG